MTMPDIARIERSETTPSNSRVGPPRSISRWLIPTSVVAIAAGVVIVGIWSRMRAEADLHTVTAQLAVPSVAVVHPKPAAPADEIILPGSIQPFISSPVYARTDGYLKKWYFDIGAHVREGQLLATIQSPEIDE